MDSPAEVLAQRFLGFREALGRAYIAQLGGDADAEAELRLGDEDALIERVDDAKRAGALSAAEHAALCAHLARAVLERSFRSTRAARRELIHAAVRVQSSERPLGSVLAEWLGSRRASDRRRLSAQLEPAWAAHTERARPALWTAEARAVGFLQQLAPERHADAGPEDGSRAVAEAWLVDTADLAQEAFGYARRVNECDADDGEDTLWAALAPRYATLYPREGRARRVGGELGALGLLEPLRRHVRVSHDQHDVLLGTQLIAVRVPGLVRIAASAFDAGLAAEWRAAEAVGRAAALALSAPSAFPALRHPAAGSVARALGSALCTRFSDPEFLRKQRGLSRREADDTARCAVAHSLLESRVLAASVLARGRTEDATHGLIERALLGPLGPAFSVFLATRVSASACLRGKLHGPALAAALRERFDGDWIRNPRASDTLCGAAARAGALSVESLAEELSVTIARGIALYSELF